MYKHPYWYPKILKSQIHNLYLNCDNQSLLASNISFTIGLISARLNTAEVKGS